LGEGAAPGGKEHVIIDCGCAGLSKLRETGDLLVRQVVVVAADVLSHMSIQLF
jgi:hypothetical protein